MAENMHGKTIVVTGGTSGIGRATVLALAAMSAEVIFSGRNAAGAEEVIAAARAKNTDAKVSFLPVDFASLKSVADFATAVRNKTSKIDVLINNAGASPAKFERSADGIEMTLAVNHLAPFLLTHLLLPAIADGGRIVNVASKMHSWRSFNFADPQLTKKWSGTTAYSQSKLANVMFTYQLAEKLAPRKITVNCLHPGVIATEITRDMPSVVQFIARLISKSPEKGAETSVYLATAAEVAGVTGKYFDNKKAVASSAESQDPTKQQQLWKLTEGLLQGFL